MLAFEGDGKVSEDFNEAGPNGLALLFRICFALQHCPTSPPTASAATVFMTASWEGTRNACLMQDRLYAVQRVLNCVYSLTALSTKHAMLFSNSMANTSSDSRETSA